MIAPVSNGFPLLQFDTGGYLARWYEGTLVPSRPVVYGLILYAGAPLSFWPVVILQAALTVWVIALTLRAHGFGRIPLLLAGTIAVLSLISTLPWLTSIFLTDIFAGLGVLALYLLLLRPGSLSRGERFALIALIAICAATHSATIAVLLALGAILVLAANFMVAKRLSWAPGGFACRSAACCRTASFKNISMITPPIRSLGCVPTYKDQLPDDAEVWF